MYCARCGHRQSEVATYCGYCGDRLPRLSCRTVWGGDRKSGLEALAEIWVVGLVAAGSAVLFGSWILLLAG